MAAQGEGFTMGSEGSAEVPLSFGAFVLGLASTALIHLGVHPNPETGALELDLTLARQSIDVLSMLKAKTQGNLTADEEQLFRSVLSDLQLRFVEARKGR